MSNKTPEQIAEARDWASDCLGKSAGVKVSAERAIKYVESNYPGGWDGFVAEIFPEASATCATTSCNAMATREITYPGLDGRTVREAVCQPCGSKYVTADPYVTMTGL